ncbi:MAG: F0F1 ATP synthase subunit A [Spirochaetia bacterium]|nr:F0F1 ATP synthase subunit A [Spirochaetia bacterium]
MVPVLTSESFNVVEVIVHHLQDMPLWRLEIGGIDLSITKRVMMMWIGSFFLLLIFIPIARRISKDPYKKPSRFSGMMEVFINFIRKDVGEASMGHYSKHYDPFLLTLFFFILIANLIGLIPPLGEVFLTFGELTGLVHHEAGAAGEIPFLVKLWPGITSTGDVGVTAALAGISFLVIQIAGFAHQGIAYIKNIVPNGIPGPMWIIMWPIEVFGQFTKPFALAIRLLANMTAGHMIILVFMGFIFQFQSYFVVPVSILASTAIYMLELFVAFLQAYIFVFLTALFVAGAQHRH